MGTSYTLALFLGSWHGVICHRAEAPLCVSHSASEEAGRGTDPGQAGSTGVCQAPTRTVVVLYWIWKGIALLFVLYWGMLSYKDLLEMGTPDGLGTHAQPMPRVSIGRLVLPAMVAPFISLTFSTDLAFVWLPTQFLLGQILNASSHALTPWIRILVLLFWIYWLMYLSEHLRINAGMMQRCARYCML